MATVTTAIGLVAAALVAFAAMVHGAGGFEWSLFYPWVLGPYFVLLAVFLLPRAQSLARRRAGATSTVVVFLSTAWVYVDAMWFSVSSTSALVFVFTPALILVGGLIVWAIGWLAFRGGARAPSPGS